MADTPTEKQVARTPILAQKFGGRRRIGTAIPNRHKRPNRIANRTSNQGATRPGRSLTRKLTGRHSCWPLHELNSIATYRTIDAAIHHHACGFITGRDFIGVLAVWHPCRHSGCFSTAVAYSRSREHRRSFAKSVGTERV
jgi:hypothetical protein